MARYDISERPQTLEVVWEQDGTEWELNWDGLWYSVDLMSGGHDWLALLHKRGPVFDVRPISVGDRISIDSFMTMPDGSVAASDKQSYIVGDGKVYVTGHDWGLIPNRLARENIVTILRIGVGKEAK